MRIGGLAVAYPPGQNTSATAGSGDTFITNVTNVSEFVTNEFITNVSATASPTTHVLSSRCGLGDGITTDSAALATFFASLSVNFTEEGLDRASLGIRGEISAGIWNGSNAGYVILGPATSVGGEIVIDGQGAGATKLVCPDRGSIGGVAQGCMNSAQNLTAASRSGNTFTLTFSSPWFGSAPTLGTAPSSSKPLCQPFDMIWLKVLSEGVLKWAAYTVTANNVAGDYSKIQYNAFASGMATDGCIPPTGQSVYFVPGYFLHPLNFRNPHALRLYRMSLVSGSSTGTPLDGFGVRRSSGMFIDDSVTLDGWFMNECINGSQMPNLLGYGAQNTDHSNSDAVYSGAQFNVGFVTNSQEGGSATDPIGGSTRSAVGGGRDNHFRNADMGNPGISHIFIADDGTMATCNLGNLNTKSGQAVFQGSGVNGVLALENLMIDRLLGAPKFESPGNFVFDDQSETRVIWGMQDWTMALEAAISINGGGNNTDFTDKPYHLTHAQIISSVFTATITETGHGLVVGTPIQVGGGGPVATLDSSMNGQHFGSSIPTNITCNENLVTLGMPSSGQVYIASSTGNQLVTYTGIGGTGNKQLQGCSGGKTNSTMATNGSVTSQALAFEGAISAMNGTGTVITVPLPQYTGPDVDSAGSLNLTCRLGRIGFMRCGTFSRGDGQYDWDLQGVDRYVQGGMHFTLQSAGPSTIRMTQNNLSSAPRKKLPLFRIRDFEGVGGTHATCTATGKLFHTTETKFNQSDVGKAITCANLFAGVDVIAAFVDVNTVVMSNTVTNGSNLTWSMASFTVPADAPRILIERGHQKFMVACRGSGSDDIDLGSLVELDTSAGWIAANASVASQLKALLGAAVTGAAPTNGRVSVSAVGTGTTALVVVNSPTFLVMEPASVIVQSDAVQFQVTGSVDIGDTLVDDGAANPGKVKTAAVTGSVPNAGQRIVGYALGNDSGGTVSGYLAPERWTY